ncbi:hypothetical protein ACFLYO_10530 [Chloroflexota bacterium]
MQKSLFVIMIFLLFVGAIPLAAQGGPGTQDFPIRDFDACINLPDFTVESDPDAYNTVFDVPGLFSINFAEFLMTLDKTPRSNDELYGVMLMLLDTVGASDYERRLFDHSDYYSAAAEFTLDGERMFGMIYLNQYGRPFFLFADKAEGFDMLAIGRAIFPARRTSYAMRQECVPLYTRPPEVEDQGGWGACGSCDTCGHFPRECVLSPKGVCEWNPGWCVYDEIDMQDEDCDDDGVKDEDDEDDEACDEEFN